MIGFSEVQQKRDNNPCRLSVSGLEVSISLFSLIRLELDWNFLDYQHSSAKQ